MTRDEYIMEGVRAHYDEAITLGHEVVGVWLQGSQNYKLDCYDDTYKSDIDTKCIVLPSVEDIVQCNAPYSSTHVRSNDEHIDIKDIRVMFDMFKKQNSAYIELLFTKYYIINPKYEKLVNELLSHAEQIAHLNKNQALRCFAGTSLTKVKNLAHPFPKAMDKINKFGYDPKQLHHIIRVNDLLKKYISGLPYSECLIPDNAEELLEIKKGKYSYEEAKKLAQEYDDSTNLIKQTYTESPEIVDKETLVFLDALKVRFISKYLREQLLSEQVKE